MPKNKSENQNVKEELITLFVQMLQQVLLK